MRRSGGAAYGTWSSGREEVDFYEDVTEAGGNKKAGARAPLFCSFSLLYFHLRLHGHAGAEKVIGVLIVVGQIDADRDTLDDLDIVSSGIFRRKEAQNGAGCAADLRDLAIVFAAAVGIDADFYVLALAHMLELRFLEVGGNPDVVKRDERCHILADADVLADLDTLFRDNAGGRGDDRGVAEVELGLVERGASLLHLRSRLVCTGSLDGHLLRPGFGVSERCLRGGDAI